MKFGWKFNIFDPDFLSRNNMNQFLRIRIKLTSKSVPCPYGSIFGPKTTSLLQTFGEQFIWGWLALRKSYDFSDRILDFFGSKSCYRNSGRKNWMHPYRLSCTELHVVQFYLLCVSDVTPFSSQKQWYKISHEIRLQWPNQIEFQWWTDELQWWNDAINRLN